MVHLKLKHSLFFCIVLIALTSCNENTILDKSIEIENKEWDIKQIIKLETNIENVSDAYNFYVNIRHGATYPYSNMYVFVTTTMPNGKSLRDTLECVFSDDKGHWLGKSAGNIVDHRIPFKKNVRFPEKGLYKFEVEQAMRMEKLPDVLDAGLRIEKVEAK